MTRGLSPAVLGLKSGAEIQLCLNEVHLSLPEVAPKLESLINALVADAQRAHKEAGPSAAAAAVPKEELAVPGEDILSMLKGMPLLQPRGKYDILFGRESIHLSSAKALLSVAYLNVLKVYLLEGMPAEHKDKMCMVLELARGSELTHGKRTLHSVALDLKAGTQLCAKNPKLAKDGTQKADVQGEAAVVMCTLLGAMKCDAFVEPKKSVFSSGGHLFIAAHFKTSQGYLYPLESALVYVGSPCQVTHHHDILGVEMNGAGSGLRTFSIVLYDKAGDIITEYTQMPAADLNPWLVYMAEMRLKQVTGEVENTDEENQSAGETDESEADDDFDPAAEAGAERPKKRVRSEGAAGAASSSAAAAAGGAGDGVDAESDEDGEDESEEDDDDYESDEMSDPEVVDEQDGCSVAQLGKAISKQSKG